MSKNTSKIQAIIKTYLLLNGDSTSREISQFINGNNFKMGNILISSQSISLILNKQSKIGSSMLYGLQMKGYTKDNIKIWGF